jgi:molecular chaperone GrpE
LAQTARQEQVEQLLQSVARQPQLERLIEVVAGQAALDELADSLKKLTRTQFKANTLAESKEQQVESALGTLREIATRRTPPTEQPPVQSSQQQLATARREARAEFAAELLPALDSVELAFTNGRLLLERQQANLTNVVAPRATPPPAPLATPTPGFWQRMFGETAAPAPVIVRSGPDPEAVQATFTTVKDAFAAWLRGIELVSDRFAALLAKEEIHPIEALHQPFDPRLHVAVESEERRDVEPNTVVRVLRKGYRQQQRVLRYAEVVVARAPKQ